MIKTMNVINDVMPVGESNEDVANVFDELDRRLLELTSDSVVKIPEASLTDD